MGRDRDHLGARRRRHEWSRARHVSPNYFPRRRGFGASGASSRYSTGTTFYEGSFVKPPIVGTHCGMRPRRFGAAPFGATIHFPFLHPIRPLRSSRVRCCGSRLTAAALAAPGHCRLSVLGDGSAPASGTPYPSCAPRARRAVGGPLSVLVSAQSPATVPVVPRTHPLSNSVALGDRQPGLPFGGSGGVLPSCGP